MKFKLDWFLTGMMLAVALAWLWPAPGAQGGWLYPELLNKLGVAFVFYLHGVALSYASFKAASWRWPVHGVAQGCTFLVFPLVGISGLMLCGTLLPADLRLGFFFLCALPSTVSSSIALTAAARGNVAAAVFNATLSSLLGVFLTPLWMGWWLQQAGTPLPLGPVIQNLVLWLIGPFVAGQLSRPWLGEWAGRRKAYIHVADRLTILFLVYTSFCNSMQQGVWSNHGISTLAVAFLGALLLFAAMFALTTGLCRVLQLPAADSRAAIFCGSKKTLASGVPLAQLMFAGNPGLGLILLPLMIYHPLQLALGGLLASHWGKQPPGNVGAS